MNRSILTYAPLRGLAACQTSPLLHVTAQAKEQSINKTQTTHIELFSPTVQRHESERIDLVDLTPQS